MSDQTADHNDDHDAPRPGLITKRNAVVGILLLGGAYAAYAYMHFEPSAPEKRQVENSSEQSVGISPKDDPVPPAGAGAKAAPAAPAATTDPSVTTGGFDPLQSRMTLASFTEHAPPPVKPAEPNKPDALPQAVAYSQKPIGGVDAVSLPDPYTSIYPDTPIYLTCDRLDTEHPGPFMCSVYADVKSASGNVPLIRRGSWLHGRIDGQLQRGQSSISAGAAYIITTDNKFVPLASDPLLNDQGAAGVKANVNDHLPERLKAGAILTFLDGAFSLGQSALSKTGSINVSTGNAQSAADEAFSRDLSIPPTGTRDQGATAIIRTSQVITFPGYRLHAQ